MPWHGAQCANIGGMFLFNPMTVPNSKERNLPNDVETFEEEGVEEAVEAEGIDKSDRYFQDAVRITFANWVRYRDEILPAYTLTDMEFCDNYREDGYAFSFHHELNSLNFESPVTVFTGRQDDSAGYEDSWKLLKRLPRLTFVALDGVGPLMHIENPNAFNFHLGEWLERIK